MQLQIMEMMCIYTDVLREWFSVLLIGGVGGGGGWAGFFCTEYTYMQKHTTKFKATFFYQISGDRFFKVPPFLMKVQAAFRNETRDTHSSEKSWE